MPKSCVTSKGSSTITVGNRHSLRFADKQFIYLSSHPSAERDPWPLEAKAVGPLRRDLLHPAPARRCLRVPGPAAFHQFAAVRATLVQRHPTRPQHRPGYGLGAGEEDQARYL